MVFQRLLVFFATVIDKIATAILPKSWASELRVLVHLAVHPVIGDTHKARLESFYGAQAADYDAFRKRLLQGREQLVTEALTAAGGGGGVWVDLGGGTGANLDMAGDEVVMSFAKVYVVDLCGPLLKVARERCAARGWHNVECVEADATTWLPDEGRGKVDLVTFSYSLTMIPDWFAAVDHAAALLADDGVVGAVDFYVARKHPAVGWGRHGWLTRTFWPVRTPPPPPPRDAAPLTPHTLPFAGVVRQRQRLSLVGAPAVPPQDLCAVEGPRAREPRAVHRAAAARGAVLHLRRQAEGVAAIARSGPTSDCVIY